METNSKPPLLSVVMAVRNEEKYIESTLLDLLTQDINYNQVEILIADGDSGDNTLLVIQDILARYKDRNVKIYRNPLQLLYCGINRLICESKGEILLKVDCHTRYPSDFFKMNLIALEKTDTDIVGGICLIEKTSGWLSETLPACLSSRFGVGNSKWRTQGKSGESDVVPFPCIKRTVLSQIGLFREEFKRNADIDFFCRARKAGFKVRLDSEIRSIYFPRPTLKETASQMFKNGKWFPVQISAARFRHFVPFVFVSSLLFLPVLALITKFLWILWLGIIAIYLAAGLASAFTYRRAEIRLHNRFKMLICYFVIHFFYGIGWIYGFFSKDVRKTRKSSKKIHLISDCFEIKNKLEKINLLK